MERTLSEIIKKVESGAECSEVEDAIAGAYWAGQSMMRGHITEQIASRMKALPISRYHRFARQAAEHVCLGVDGINVNYINAYGDSGTGEAAEILDWEFEV